MAVIQYAGEFQLEECTLCTVSGLELDLTELVADINIYEDLFSTSVSGSISFQDNNNLLGNKDIGIIGQEKLKLKLSTPNADDTGDRNRIINYTETPLYVYKIDDKVTVNENTDAFMLHFTTPEFIRNNHVRVVKSYEGEPSEDIIQNILRDDDLISSKKEFYYEVTNNHFKLVSPNMHPFDFIVNLSKRCLSREYDYAPSFLFYETTKGYFFRTIDSMMDRKNPKGVFREVSPQEIDLRDNEEGVIAKLSNILNIQVMSTTDTVSSRLSGMYGSRLILLDIFNKDYQEFDYNYIQDFDRDIHVDHYNRYGSSKSPVASTVTDQYGKQIGDYPDSVLHVQMIERNIANGMYNPAWGERSQYDYMGTDQWLQRRTSRFSSLDSAISLRVTIPGNTTLQVGDLIGLDLSDEAMTGKYLVKNLVHKFTFAEGSPMHKIVMDCVRDTVKSPFPSSGVTIKDQGNEGDYRIPLGSEDPSEITF